jgi:hypothetical protein
MSAVAVGGQLVSAEVLAGNPGPAAHIALLAIVVVAALVIFGIGRRRRRRETEERDQELGPRH